MSVPYSIANSAPVQIARRIFRHFDTIPSCITLNHYRFYIISNIGYTLGWALHSIWLFIFLAIAQQQMMWIQLGSIACHVIAIIINRRGIHQPAMGLGMLEVVVHQALAVYFLGWGTGFQYIIIAITVFPFLLQDGSWLFKSALVTMCAVSYIMLQALWAEHTPLAVLTPSALSAFRYSNIVICFGLMATWAYFLTVAIQRAEDVLVQRNKELFLAEKATEQASMQHKLEMKERDMEIYRLRNVELKNSNEEIALRNLQIEEEKKKSESLLRNILPEVTANELLAKGSASTHRYEMVTVMFSDFVEFTHTAEQMSPERLVQQMDTFFRVFDEIVQRHGVEKIKTIGDAYMCAGGLPVANTTKAEDVLNAALEIAAYIRANNDPRFRIRIGIHTGQVVAGVVGRHKFQYDIWGDAVNIAARMEQNSSEGKINISQKTYELVKDKYNCTFRGELEAKNKGRLHMYFVEGKLA